MNDFLAFRKMITPVIIQILFWVGVVVVVLAGVANIVGGMGTRFGGGTMILGGLFMILVGPFLVRIYCELLILFFRMNETLTDITNTLEHTPTPMP